MPHYKLTYFDARGYVEPCRLILAYAGVEYDDVRIPLGKLTPELRAELRVGHEHLPSLEIDGEIFTQSCVIARHLATQFGLVSDDELENLRMEECVSVISEFVMKLVPLFCDKTPADKREEIRMRVLRCDNVFTMNFFDKLLKKNLEAGNIWLVGQKFSWADIFFAYTSTQFNDTHLKVDVLMDYPELQKLRKRVFDIPSLKEYIRNRPVTLF